MYSKKQIEIEMNRVLDRMSKADCATDQYINCLDALLKLRELRMFTGEDLIEKESVNTEAPTPEKSVVKEEPVTKEEPKVVKPAPSESSNPITKEELKTLLLALAKEKGIKLQSFIEKYVPVGKPVKLSEIPVSQYNAILEEVRNA